MMGLNNGFQIGIFVVVCVAALLSAATLVLVAVRNGKEQNNGESTRESITQSSDLPTRSTAGQDPATSPVQCEHVDDVAIIGAGIAGSYAAWRLRDANMTVTIYEYSDRIGGRCNTVRFPDAPDTNIELGAMRFVPEEHIMLNRTISKLGLEVVDFLPGTLGSQMYYLRGEHLSTQQIVDQAPYKLKPEDRKAPQQLKWEIFDNYTNVDSSIDGYTDVSQVLNYRTPDGIPLYQQSVESFNGKYLYPELAAYLEDTSMSINEDISASNSLPTQDPKTPTEPTSLKTVANGFQSIPETMVEQFLDSSNLHSFQPNHHLRSIRKYRDMHYVLHFHPTLTSRGITKETPEKHLNICAKTVLLAIPRLALEQLSWEGLKEPTTSDIIKNSLYDAKAAKIYLSYDKPWWRNIVNSAPTVYSTTPLRLTYDFGVSNLTGTTVLNSAYSNLDTSIWRNTLTQGNPVPGVGDDSIEMTDVAQNMTRKFLAEIYGIPESEVPVPAYSVLRIWDEYPIGASWYHYRSGYNWTEVAQHMLKPSMNDDVYIISNTFSGTGLQTWTEGALEIVDNLLRLYFPDFYDI